MPDTFDLLDEVTLNSPNKDYDYGGATTELPEGKYYHLNASLDDFVLNDFEDEWLRAAKVELNGKAQKRDAHKHVIYRVVADADARRTALDDAFTD